MHDIKAFQRNRNEAIQTLTAAFLIHFWFKGPSKLFGSFKEDNLVAGLSSDKQLVYLNFFLHDWSILPRYQVHLQFAITGQLSKLTRHQYKLSAITFFFFSDTRLYEYLCLHFFFFLDFVHNAATAFWIKSKHIQA